MSLLKDTLQRSLRIKLKMAKHFARVNKNNPVDSTMLLISKDRSSHRRCSLKKPFLTILQYSEKKNCVRVINK